MDFEMEATSPQFTAPICFESNFSLPFFFLFLFCFVVVFFKFLPHRQDCILQILILPQRSIMLKHKLSLTTRSP